MTNWFARKYQRKMQKLSRNKARIVVKLQNKLAAQDGPALRRRFISKALHFLAPANRYLPLAAYASQSKPLLELAPATPFVTEAPRKVGAAPDQQTGTFPPVWARLFARAEVYPVSSTIVTRDKIAIPPLYVGRPDLLITDGQFLLSQVGNMGTVFCPSPVEIEKGVALFASGVSNWYHWLIEILPWALLAEDLPQAFDDFPFLVPETCLDYPTFRDSLALFTGNRKIVTLAPSRPARVRDLVQIDGVAICPMNLVEGRWPVPSDFSQNAPVLNRYRSEIIRRLGLQPAAPGRRIFLARGNDRRSYNQTELLEIAMQHGFEAVYPEKLSFREQVEVFASASAVIGPSGAAFANTLFCQPGSRGLSWLIPHYDGFCAYSNLAQVVGMKLDFLFVAPTTPINSSFEGYNAAYTVDPAAFESALRAIITSD